MSEMEKVEATLRDMHIQYDIVHHPAALTTEDADRYIEGKDGIRSKTLFMSGKKDRAHYLIIMDESKRINIQQMNEITGDKLHFGKEENLYAKMRLAPGVVSLFGLLNNAEHDIVVYIDRAVLNEKIITFHPNENTATVFISVDDMFTFLKNIHHPYTVIDLKEPN
ncbi:MAG: prolyl-tRNA synthetase associated domain-containing protein [Treponema sp.]|nr:prolyl-tRNA synthetase associated domain-containing protein [Treponema sp.]